MTEDLLRVDRPLPGVARITLNRPSSMNALSMALRRAVVSAVDALTRDANARVLVLTGAGRTFCAGLNLREIGDLHLGENARAADPVAALGDLPGPIIGAVNGAAVTGGLEST